MPRASALFSREPSRHTTHKLNQGAVTTKNADLATAKRLDRVAGATPRAQKSMSIRSLKSSTKAYIISKDMPALAMRCVMEASNEAMNVAQTHAPRLEILIGPGPRSATALAGSAPLHVRLEAAPITFDSAWTISGALAVLIRDGISKFFLRAMHYETGTQLTGHHVCTACACVNPTVCP